MRNKLLIQQKLERVDSELGRLNFFIKTNDQRSSRESVEVIKEIHSDINTLLNREIQD